MMLFLAACRDSQQRRPKAPQGVAPMCVLGGCGVGTRGPRHRPSRSRPFAPLMNAYKLTSTSQRNLAGTHGSTATESSCIRRSAFIGQHSQVSNDRSAFIGSMHSTGSMSIGSSMGSPREAPPSPGGGRPRRAEVGDPQPTASVVMIEAAADAARMQQEHEKAVQARLAIHIRQCLCRSISINGYY